MLEKLCNASFSNGDISLNKINSDIIIFFSDGMGVLSFLGAKLSLKVISLSVTNTEI